MIKYAKGSRGRGICQATLHCSFDEAALLRYGFSMSDIHKSLAAGRWHTLTLAEQLGNIGSEVGRALSWHHRNPERYEGALARGLELFDLTLADPRWSAVRRREIARAREVFLDVLDDHPVYGSVPADVERWFTAFAIKARR